MALYKHCHSQRVNLLVSSLTKTIGFRNVVDTIQDTTSYYVMDTILYFFNLSPKRQEHLEKVIKENFLEAARKKLLDVCQTK